MNSHFEEKSIQTFQYGNKTVEYILIKSKRRKTCEVIVDKNELTIRAPFDKPLIEVEGILNDKIKWISQKQKEIQINKAEIVRPSFDNNSTLPYLGKNYDLNIIYDKYITEERIEFYNNIFRVYLNNEENKSNKKLKSIYEDWLVFQANRIFKNKVSQYSKIIDIIPNRIVIKNLKNRWGSVTKNKTINLNVNLVKAPEDVIDYIIIHELCHFKIKGHSYQFWDYLKQFMSDYKQKIEWLSRNTQDIIQ